MLLPKYPVSTACEFLKLPRSNFYYDSSKGDDLQMRDEIEKIALEFPRYGYRRMTAELKRRGYCVNHKRVLRLMRADNLLVHVKRCIKTTNSNHCFGDYPNLLKELEIEGPEHVWCGDITYIQVRREFLYLAILMDIYTRGIRGWELSRSLDERLTVKALERSFENGIPGIHHSDHGVQYACKHYVQMLEGAGVKISMASKGKAWENPYVERLIRTLKEEEVYLHEYEDYDDAYEHIGHFLEDVYTQKRVHSALGYMTPAEFQAAYEKTDRG